jgi:hypothetical protein
MLGPTRAYHSGAQIPSLSCRELGEGDRSHAQRLERAEQACGLGVAFHATDSNVGVGVASGIGEQTS